MFLPSRSLDYWYPNFYLVNFNRVNRGYGGAFEPFVVIIAKILRQKEVTVCIVV